MKILIICMLIIAIIIMLLSIGGFLRIKKELKTTLYCSYFQNVIISNAYVVLLCFFVLAYVIYAAVEIRTIKLEVIDYMMTLLLFFGSMFVGISTVFLRRFVQSVLGIKMNQTDVMTGLMTKNGIEVMATNILNEIDGDYVFVVMDLDNFKQVNDIYGHLAGDEIISLVANCIRDTVRSDDMVGRFGGDEYLIILKNINKENAEKILRRIEQQVLQILQEKQYTVCTGISFGMAAMKGKSGVSYHTILEEADSALYQSKKAKKDNIL